MLLCTQYITIRGLSLSTVTLSRCITCKDVCVHQSHAGLPFSDFKLIQIAHQKNIRTIKKGRRQRGASGALPPHLKSVPSFRVWPQGYCIHPILYLKNVSPLFLSPLLRNPGDESE